MSAFEHDTIFALDLHRNFMLSVRVSMSEKESYFSCKYGHENKRQGKSDFPNAIQAILDSMIKYFYDANFSKSVYVYDTSLRKPDKSYQPSRYKPRIVISSSFDIFSLEENYAIALFVPVLSAFRGKERPGFAVQTFKISSNTNRNIAILFCAC